MPEPYEILRFFEYEHLPPRLGCVSMLFHDLAHDLAKRLPKCAETTVALRKILEAKDAAVRATLLDGSAYPEREGA